MNNVRKALFDILRNDVIVDAYIGRDDREQPKVYEAFAPKDLGAPYVVWNLIAGEMPRGLYHDLRAVETLMIQIACWGRTRDEAWTMFEGIREALEISDWDTMLTPYNKLSLVSMGDQRLLEELENMTVQVPCTYRLVIAR